MWIDPSIKEEALFRGCTVVDPPSVLTTHLTEVVRENMAELLSYAETQKLLDELPREQQKLVADLIPSQITAGGVQRVLQSLLSERVSIRDLATILEGIQEACGGAARAIPTIVAHVRARLARQISDSHIGAGGYLPLVTLSAEWEAEFAEALSGSAEDRQLAMPPSRLQEFMQRLRAVFETAASAGESPVLLTSGGIRSHVRAIVERIRPTTPVLAQSEIYPRARIRTVGTI
jgi:flagellar biosynthesis protein FlhA